MASRRRHRRKACAGKVRHLSREAAFGSILAGGARFYGCEPYLCPHCKGWHIGHPIGLGRRHGARRNSQQEVAA